ncbi:MAG: hypothetical protein IPK76_18885 [Lewinellaceae bacterium]|nr:hypothetical protein [Lewinellaceae bacterium]
MKIFLITLTVLILASMVSCSKAGPDSYYWGECTAQLNGVAWTGQPYIIENKPYLQGIDLLVDVYNGQGFHRENVFIYKIPDAVGRYQIVDTDVRDIDSLTGARYFTLGDDGDVLVDSYRLVSDKGENYVEIERKEGDQIWGAFQIAFAVDGVKGNPAAPDTIIFTDGHFHTRRVQ